MPMCNNIATETCQECSGARYCTNHMWKHGHIKKTNVEYMGPSVMEGKPIATIYIPDEKSESFSDLLSFQRTLLMDKIHALRVLNEKSSKMVEEYLESEKKNSGINLIPY
jgi:hypothetical protein